MEVSDVIVIYIIYSENTDLTMTSETSERKKKLPNLLKKLNIFKSFGLHRQVNVFGTLDNAMFKRGEARDMERVAYFHSYNVSVRKTIFKNRPIR